MNRLVCGDVGFGKTEIAIRAAFKAVMDGKQVAMLVPTTVLALQHYQTFTQRLAPYPVKIAMLSRLQSPKEQKEVINGLRTGAVRHRDRNPSVAFGRCEIQGLGLACH
jgi:transcription-repair coupling factor (superfamily II helicase)